MPRNITAPNAAPPKPTLAATPAPAVSWKTALSLAFLRTLATVSFAVVLAAVFVVEFGDRLSLTWQSAAAAIAGLAGVTFAASLWRNTSRVQQATWREETATGQDLDGDGYVGPPIGRLVKVRSPRGEGEILRPNEERAPVVRPLVHFPQDPPVTADDVLHVLERAMSRREGGGPPIGLVIREWEGYRLPNSGTVIDRDVWNGILDGLVRWGFAVQHRDRRRRRIAKLRTEPWLPPDEALRLEDMIHAVQLGAQAGKG